MELFYVCTNCVESNKETAIDRKRVRTGEKEDLNLTLPLYSERKAKGKKGSDLHIQMRVDKYVH